MDAPPASVRPPLASARAVFGPERQSVINGTSSRIAFIDASDLLMRLAEPGSMARCDPASLVPTLRAESFSSQLRHNWPRPSSISTAEAMLPPNTSASARRRGQGRPSAESRSRRLVRGSATVCGRRPRCRRSRAASPSRQCSREGEPAGRDVEEHEHAVVTPAGEIETGDAHLLMPKPPCFETQPRRPEVFHTQRADVVHMLRKKRPGSAARASSLPTNGRRSSPTSSLWQRGSAPDIRSARRLRPPRLRRRSPRERTAPPSEDRRLACLSHMRCSTPFWPTGSWTSVCSSATSLREGLEQSRRKAS